MQNKTICSAKIIFQLADDYLSLVRVHCYCENMEKAAEIANESGDKVHTLNSNKMYKNNVVFHFTGRLLSHRQAVREHGRRSGIDY